MPNDTTSPRPDDAAGTNRRADIVPGVMHCAKCKFQLIRNILYMGNGAVGAGTNETEPCPNGCGPLWPLSWRQYATELGERLESTWQELQDANAELDTLRAEIATLRAQLAEADAALVELALKEYYNIPAIAAAFARHSARSQKL